MTKEEEKATHQVVEAIAQLFSEHGISNTQTANKIEFTDRLISLEAFVTYKKEVPDQVTACLDVFLDYGIVPVIEQLAGFGKDEATATQDAIKSFLNYSFYTLLSAFFTSAYESEILKFQWSIQEKEFEVFVSQACIRGKKPDTFETSWVNDFCTVLETDDLPLEEGTHWLSLFYAQVYNKTLSCQVKKNNQINKALTEKVKFRQWEIQEAFYSVRVLFILKSGLDFNRVMKLVSLLEEFEEAEEKLAEMGLSLLEMELANECIPEAFGRILLKKLGVTGEFKEYIAVTNADNETFELDLTEEPMFQRASAIVLTLIQNGWSQEYKNLAYRSASFQAASNALSKGEELQPQDLDGSELEITFYVPHYKQYRFNFPKADDEKIRELALPYLWG